MVEIRSSTENSGVFSLFPRTATMIESKMREPRSMMSTWPLVSGSNDPGYTARLAVDGAAEAERPPLAVFLVVGLIDRRSASCRPSARCAQLPDRRAVVARHARHAR